jgi:hypothetical protein
MGIDSLKRWNDLGGKVGRYCRDCKDRYPACHDTCEKYLEAKKEHEEYVQTVLENRNREKELYLHKLNTMRREDRKKRS